MRLNHGPERRWVLCSVLTERSVVSSCSDEWQGDCCVRSDLPSFVVIAVTAINFISWKGWNWWNGQGCDNVHCKLYCKVTYLFPPLSSNTTASSGHQSHKTTTQKIETVNLSPQRVSRQQPIMHRVNLIPRYQKIHDRLNNTTLLNLLIITFRNPLLSFNPCMYRTLLLLHFGY